MCMFMTDVRFEPIRMRRRRLALRCTSSLPTSLPKLPQAQITQIKITAITVASVEGFIRIFFFNFL